MPVGVLSLVSCLPPLTPPPFVYACLSVLRLCSLRFLPLEPRHQGLSNRPTGLSKHGVLHCYLSGDARDTCMGRRRGEVNLGQLMREKFGEDKVHIIGQIGCAFAEPRLQMPIRSFLVMTPVLLAACCPPLLARHTHGQLSKGPFGQRAGKAHARPALAGASTGQPLCMATQLPTCSSQGADRCQASAPRSRAHQCQVQISCMTSLACRPAIGTMARWRRRTNGVPRSK